MASETPMVCVCCGATGYQLSFGGADICPSCDCGLPPGLVRLKRELAQVKAERDAALIDAERYRWLRDIKCCSMSLTLNDDHSPNYVDAAEWIEEHAPEDFVHTPPEEVQRMKDTNTIWGLQIYPHTPIGFNKWNAASLDAAIDAARQTGDEHGK
jgi:hypothetical protein